jgi:myo-inositol-1(or 4)-monophosphatase
MVEEAGGIYTDFNGNPIDYSNPLKKTTDNFTFIAGAPAIHQKLLEIIKSSA